MCRRPALGPGVVNLGGGKLHAVTNRSPGLHAEGKSSGGKLQGQVEDDRGFKGRKRAAVEAADSDVCSKLRWSDQLCGQVDASTLGRGGGSALAEFQGCLRGHPEAVRGGGDTDLELRGGVPRPAPGAARG